MRTRSQGYQPPGPDGGVSDDSAPGGGSTEQPQLELGERSSVRPPTTSQTQPEVMSAIIPDISEPVIKALDRRIRTLLAQTTTGKMMLDRNLTELTKMTERHVDYVKAREQAEMLIDRAYQLKNKVRKAEQLEEKLISDLSNLTLLLELLNLDGDEVEKARGVELGNKVTSEITKYKGLVEEFQHKHRETLTFAIPKKRDSSQQSSANSSRNSSLERRNQVNRMHDHLRPGKGGWEDELEVILDMQEKVYFIDKRNNQNIRPRSII